MSRIYSKVLWFFVSFALVLSIFTLGLVKADASPATGNYSWTQMPNVGTGQLALDGTNGNYVEFYNGQLAVYNQSSQTWSHLPAQSTSDFLILASNGDYWLGYGSTIYVYNESNGQLVTVFNRPTSGSYYDSLVTDANGNIWDIRYNSLTSCIEVWSMNSTGILGSKVASTVPNVSFPTNVIPFSDGSGVWVYYTGSNTMNLLNSNTGANINLSVSPGNGWPSPGQNNLTNSIKTASSQYMAWQNSNGWFVYVSANGTVTETFTGDSTIYSLILPMADGTLLEADGANPNNVYSLNPKNPTTKTSVGTWSNPSYGGSGLGWQGTGALAPDVYILQYYNGGSTADGLYALDASAPTSPYLTSSSSTQSSMAIYVGETSGTANQSFQFSLYTTNGTLVQQSGWVSWNSLTFSGLSPGTTYDVKVQAKNFFGHTGPISDLGNFATIPATPGTPTASITGAGWASSNGNDTLNVSWNPVAGAVGYHITLMNGSTILKEYDVGNVNSYSLTVPDQTHASGYVDSSGNYEVGVLAYNKSNGAWQESPLSAITTVSPILQTDTTGPQWGSNPIVLNNGQQYTLTGKIPIQINATDAQSGISQILVSNDNITWTTFSVGASTQGMTIASSYTVTSAWQLPPGAGQKTVYVKLVDLVGNTSSLQTAYEAIQSDTQPPTVSLSINGGQTQTTSTGVTLTIVAADPAYTNDQLQMSFSTDGQTWTTPETFASTKAWTLTNSTTSGSYPVFVRVSDPLANTGIGYSRIYYLNNTSAPTIGGTTGSTGGTIGVTFPSNGGTSTATTTTYNGLSNVYVVQSNQVNLDFSASGANYVSVSSDNISYSSLYKTSSPFTVNLPAGDGLKTVYAQLANTNSTSALGTTGEIYFLVDTTAPTLSISGVGGSTATSGTSFNVQLTASDNIASLTQMQYQVDGGAWQAIPSNGQITISGLTAHSGYHTSTITIKDLAGNITSQKISFWLL